VYQNTSPLKIAASATRSQVESSQRPEGAGRAAQAGHRAVQQVGEDAEEDDRRTGEEHAAREEDQRTEDRAGRAGDRDGVGADAEGEQAAGHRVDDAGERGSYVQVEHRLVVPLRSARRGG
jgi:hypothetical protein